MILFSKSISSIHSLNLLSETQKSYYRRDLDNFNNFLLSLGIEYCSHFIYSLEDARKTLQSISVENQTGILINIIAHGNGKGIGDNETFFIDWSDLIESFQAINSENNLIINTSLMCHGNGLFEYSTILPKPFYAAFGTSTKSDVGVYHYTQNILKRCINNDYILRSIQSENNMLRTNDIENFGLGFEDVEYDSYQQKSMIKFSYIF